jgi:ribosomal protein S24E
VKLLNRYLIFNLIDNKYIKSCNNWIISFKPTTNISKEQNIKKIVYALMKDPNPEIAKQIVEDFGKEIVDKYVKEYNKEFNSVKLK